jgi:hypothetical protein
MTLRRSSYWVLISALLLPSSVLAHARLVKSEPARHAALDAPPRAVRLWFSERLEPSFAHLTVTDAQGRAMDDGSAKVAADDPKELSVELSDLPPGTYTVTYDVLSVDGHKVKQSFPFTVKPSKPGP